MQCLQRASGDGITTWVKKMAHGLYRLQGLQQLMPLVAVHSGILKGLLLTLSSPSKILSAQG